MGPVAEVMRFRLPPGASPDAGASVRKQLAGEAQVVAAHLGSVGVDAAFPVANITESAEGLGDPCVLIVETLDEFRPFLPTLVDRLRAELNALDFESRTYRLVFALGQDEVDPMLWRRGRATP